MHDVVKNLSPRNISNLFSSVNVIHTYSTRFSSAGNLYTKYSKLTHQIKSFSRRGVMMWNSIPQAGPVGIPTIMSHLQTSNTVLSKAAPALVIKWSGIFSEMTVYWE